MSCGWQRPALPAWRSLVIAGAGFAIAGRSAAGTNWAGNVRFSAKELSRPNTVAELQRLVRENAAVHAVGGRHSFSSIADTAGTLISLEHFNQVKVYRENATVDARGG